MATKIYTPVNTIQSTKVSETPKGFFVEMTVSSSPDLETADDLVQFRVTLETDDRYPRFAKLQEVALRHARDAIETEIQRLQRAEGRKP
jgi:hypothetical protein